MNKSIDNYRKVRGNWKERFLVNMTKRYSDQFLFHNFTIKGALYLRILHCADKLHLKLAANHY